MKKSPKEKNSGNLHQRRKINLIQRIQNNLLSQTIPWDEETDNTIWETKKNCILDNTNENIMSLSKTNPNSIYIKGYFYFRGYKKYSLDMYVDTGASMCTVNKLVIPEEFWVQTKSPIKARIANDEIMTMDKENDQRVHFEQYIEKASAPIIAEVKRQISQLTKKIENSECNQEILTLLTQERGKRKIDEIKRDPNREILKLGWHPENLEIEENSFYSKKK